MNKVKDCLEKGLLKRIEKSLKFSLQDLKQAEFFLNEAYDLIALKKKEMALIALYNAVFHAGRAILFKDGLGERSHYCLEKYLEEAYSGKGVLEAKDLSLFDILRQSRQEVQYDTVRVEIEQDLNELFEGAEQFIEKSRKIVGKE